MLDFFWVTRLRKWGTILGGIGVLFLVFAIGLGIYIDSSTLAFRYSNVQDIPKNPVGLIL